MDAFCVVSIIVGIVALMVAHRLSKGKLSLYDKGASGSGSIIAIQEIVEPNVRHVIRVKEQKNQAEGDGASPNSTEQTNSE